MSRRLVVVLAWALIAVAGAAYAWLDHLLRQANRPDLVLFTTDAGALTVATLSAATTGSLPSPRWRWWAWVAAAVPLLGVATAALLPFQPPTSRFPIHWLFVPWSARSGPSPV